jgi:anti-sigma regulatory factor (Ser/Thr protein kinase)
MADRELSLKISASLSELSVVRKELAAFINTGLGDIDRSRTVLAVDEALANVITHGYDGREGEITLRMREEADAFIVTIEDGAPPFDPLSRAPIDIDSRLDEGADGGLGVEVLRRLTVPSYERNESGGNRLILRKEKRHEKESH